MKIEKATRQELPEGTCQGFKIMDNDEVVMFFHWVNDDDEGTHYADVLSVLPDRLEGMGYKTEVDAVLGEIIGIFGAG